MSISRNRRFLGLAAGLSLVAGLVPLALITPPAAAAPPLATCTPAETRASERFWIFGTRAVVDFGVSGTTATAGITPTAVASSEGTTVVTDTTGQLLFWSNANVVYDRNSVPMPNGTGLLGNQSSTQTVAAFPSLTNPGQYFIVTTNAVTAATPGTLRYSIVDMSLNGGLGDVTGTKNVQLGVASTGSEALAAVPNATGTGFWVLTNTWNTANVLAYEFNGSGPVSGVPVVSTTPMTNGNGFGTFNVSADLSRVAMYAGNNTTNTGNTYVGPFDAASGLFSPVYSWVDPLAPAAGTPTRPYSADFSPAGDYLYVSHIFNNGHLFRYRLAGAANSAAVLASREDLGVAQGGTGGQIRRAPNGKMYEANRNTAFLGVVNTPDAVGVGAAGFVTNGFPLAAGTNAQFGLPQTVTGCPTPISVTPPPGDPVECVGGPGHRVEFRKSSTALNNIVTNTDDLFNANVSAATVTARAFDDGRPVVNYVDSGPDPSTDSPTAVESSTLLMTTKGAFVGDDNEYGMRSSGLLVIPESQSPLLYTFTVGHDDGFRLTIGTNALSTIDEGVGPFNSDSLIVAFPEPGCYPYRLDFFEHLAGSGVDFRAAGPDITGSPLVGDPLGVQVLQGVTRAPVSKPAVLATSTSWTFGNALYTNAFSFGATYGTRPLVGLMGDWDGDGNDTLGTFESGTFKLNNQNDGSAPDLTFTFGDPRAYAVGGDFNGDGTDDVALFRNGLWQIRYLGETPPPDASFSLGAPFGTGVYPNTIPLAGDWDGDGVDGIGTYNLANGNWVLKNTMGVGPQSIPTFQFWNGFGTIPVVGDWTGIGVDNPGYRIASAWTVRTSGNPPTPVLPSQYSFSFGAANSVPFAWVGPDFFNAT